MGKLTQSPVIDLARVSKSYGSGVRALQETSIQIAPATINCIAGPNGAGKTTLLRILSTQLLPTSGTVSICGTDALRHPEAVRPHLSVVPQDAQPDPQLTVWEQVYLYLRIRGVARATAKRRTADTLKIVGLEQKSTRLTRELSGGQRRSVLIAMAVAAECRLLILDEPTASLDPKARAQLFENLMKLRTRSTILFTSHALNEAEYVADRVIIIDQGSIALDGEPNVLKRRVSHQERVIVHSTTLTRFEEYGGAQQYHDKLIIYPHDRAHRERLLDTCLAAGIEAQVVPTTLEDAYLAVVARKPITPTSARSAAA